MRSMYRSGITVWKTERHKWSSRGSVREVLRDFERTSEKLSKVGRILVGHGSWEQYIILFLTLPHWLSHTRCLPWLRTSLMFFLFKRYLNTWYMTCLSMLLFFSKFTHLSLTYLHWEVIMIFPCLYNFQKCQTAWLNDYLLANIMRQNKFIERTTRGVKVWLRELREELRELWRIS